MMRKVIINVVGLTMTSRFSNASVKRAGSRSMAIVNAASTGSPRPSPASEEPTGEEPTGEEPTEAVEVVADPAVEDYQLQRALDLLRGLDLFRPKAA